MTKLSIDAYTISWRFKALYACGYVIRADENKLLNEDNFIITHSGWDLLFGEKALKTNIDLISRLAPSVLAYAPVAAECLPIMLNS